MADHVPFVTSEEASNIVKKEYADSDVVRLVLDRAERLLPGLPKAAKLWVDPGVDGLDDLETRRDAKNGWFNFISEFPNYGEIASASFQARPGAAEVCAFVKGVLDKCAALKPAWVTVPQLPVTDGVGRNKINRALAVATGKWKSQTGFSGRLILPLVFTHQEQVNGKTARNPKVHHAERCYHDAQADGYWVVDKSLTDDNGSATLGRSRFPGIIDLHQELNEKIASKLRIAGPYWGLNLVLWARGLVDYPATGVGSGYQFFLSGGHAKQPSAKLAIPSLRRRVTVGPQLKVWLDSALGKLSASHPAHVELNDIKKNYAVLSQADQARGQVAHFYKHWFDVIAAVPKAGRSMALFQDLSAAYALGKSLPELPDEGTARRPEAVVQPLMLSCL